MTKPNWYIIGTPPLSKSCTLPDCAIGLIKITLNPSHPAHSLFELLPSFELLQTPEQFLPSSNPSHEHLRINMKHTTLLYIIYSSHIFFISNLHISDLYIHNCLFYFFFFAFLYIAYLYICILLFYYLCLFLLLSFCCTIELLSLYQIPHICKHTWPIKLILIILKSMFCLFQICQVQRGHLDLTREPLDLQSNALQMRNTQWTKTTKRK